MTKYIGAHKIDRGMIVEQWEPNPFNKNYGCYQWRCTDCGNVPNGNDILIF